MKLVIKPNSMKIVTETIQDVAYLKQIGYCSENPEIHMKVSVSKTGIGPAYTRYGVEIENDGPKEGAEIELCWEDINCGHEDHDDSAETRELIQHIEGPRLKFVKKASGTKASS